MTEIFREMIFTYRMSFGFFQVIKIKSTLRNGPWLFPGTVNSYSAINLEENFDVEMLAYLRNISPITAHLTRKLILARKLSRRWKNTKSS